MARDDDLAGMDPDRRDVFVRDRDRVDAVRAESRLRFAADGLIGMTIEQARAVVEAAGGEFVTDEQPIPMKFDLNRLVASVSAGRVTAVDIG